MSHMATSLVTRGMICLPVTQETLASCDKPSMVGVVEVRPKIRQAAAPVDVGAVEPSMVSAQELKPSMTGQLTLVPSLTDPPKNVTAQELKPKIVTAEEE